MNTTSTNMKPGDYKISTCFPPINMPIHVYMGHSPAFKANTVGICQTTYSRNHVLGNLFVYVIARATVKTSFVYVQLFVGNFVDWLNS